MKENRKTALITGITGQDGSYLANFFTEKLYRSWNKRRLAVLILNELIIYIKIPRNKF